MKLPIEKIKIDKALFSFQNDVDMDAVEHMCKNFESGAWYPVMVNKDYFYSMDNTDWLPPDK